MTYNAQPTIYATALGATASVREIPDQPSAGTGQASQTALFPAETSQPIASGGTPPSRLDFNALFKQLGATQYYIQHGGVWGYDSGISYDKGAMVLYNGAIYEAVTANGTAEAVGVVTPGTDPDVWLELGGGTGAWSVDRPLRVGDYAGANYGATIQLNEGSEVMTLVMPATACFSTVQSTGDTSTEGYTLTKNGGYYQLNIHVADGLDDHFARVDANTGLMAGYTTGTAVDGWYEAYRAGARTELTGSLGGMTYDTRAGCYAMGNYASTTESPTETYTRYALLTCDGLSLPTSGTRPAGWADTTVTTRNENGDDLITLTQVNHCDVQINGAGVRWQGYNTIGSTIMCCRRTETAGIANQYGELVAGSELCWAAWDKLGGELNPTSGSLSLTGTWVKVSGQSDANYGTWGMGLYRRIL